MLSPSSRDYRRTSFGSGNSPLVRTEEEWQYRAILEEQKWTPIGMAKIGDECQRRENGPIDSGGTQRHFEHVVEQQTYQLLERRCRPSACSLPSSVHRNRSFGRRRTVTTLKELPVDRCGSRQPLPIPSHAERRPEPPRPTRIAMPPPPTVFWPKPTFSQPPQSQPCQCQHRPAMPMPTNSVAQPPFQPAPFHPFSPAPVSVADAAVQTTPMAPPSPPPPPPPPTPSSPPQPEPTQQVKRERHQSQSSVSVSSSSTLISATKTNGTGRGADNAVVDPDKEIVNEPHGFQIRVEAKHFLDKDFKVSIDSSRVLALDGEHVVDNGNGTVTIKKMNRRWRLADDVDLQSVKAYLAADGFVEIVGEKVPIDGKGQEKPKEGANDEQIAEGMREEMILREEEQREEMVEMGAAGGQTDEQQRQLEEVEVEVEQTRIRTNGGNGNETTDFESSTERIVPSVPPKTAANGGTMMQQRQWHQ